eukprot:TRINITY_DN3732_c0_g2_i1.p1 TRINITY_DN3732_c0_g2~~TRINITY_DN3732_c0_g2_i1.p1  ORF type:complete len:466 (-),score=119.34 TRINITY_DN3732_c0_g2_i1:66-1463(-)
MDDSYFPNPLPEYFAFIKSLRSKLDSSRSINFPFNSVALYDYEGGNESELSFKQGESILILEDKVHSSRGWFWASKVGKDGKLEEGLVPSNYFSHNNAQHELVGFEIEREANKRETRLNSEEVLLRNLLTEASSNPHMEELKRRRIIADCHYLLVMHPTHELFNFINSQKKLDYSLRDAADQVINLRRKMYKEDKKRREEERKKNIESEDEEGRVSGFHPNIGKDIWKEILKLISPESGNWLNIMLSCKDLYQLAREVYDPNLLIYGELPIIYCTSRGLMDCLQSLLKDDRIKLDRKIVEDSILQAMRFEQMEILEFLLNHERFQIETEKEKWWRENLYGLARNQSTAKIVSLVFRSIQLEWKKLIMFRVASKHRAFDVVESVLSSISIDKILDTYFKVTLEENWNSEDGIRSVLDIHESEMDKLHWREMEWQITKKENKQSVTYQYFKERKKKMKKKGKPSIFR